MTARRYLCDVLEASGDVTVVGEAGDGQKAIELCQALRPDVISLDMMLPVMSGLAATEYVMAYCPTPILIVSSSTNRGELFQTYDALAAGAVDVLEKPKGTESGREWERTLVATLRLVSRVSVITHPRGRLNGMPHSRTASSTDEPDRQCGLIAIGASTGGPSALVSILRRLPDPLAVPIVVVLHIGGPFGTAFADWLDSQSCHTVVFPRDGMPLEEVRGKIALAPPDMHLTVAAGRLRVSGGPERHSCRPSVDVLFESLASEMGASTVAALLTGMGRDGAAGLLAIRRAGGLTLAQDEASSVVFGMPREAIAIGAAKAVLSLDDLAARLARLSSSTVKVTR